MLVVERPQIYGVWGLYTVPAEFIWSPAVVTALSLRAKDRATPGSLAPAP